MPTLAANLTMLFTEHSFLDRIRAAAEAGFRAIEWQLPYAEPAATLRQMLDQHRVECVLHNMPAGDWAAGDRGIACQPNRIPEFEAGVDRAIAYATTLGCQQVNCLAGIRPSHVSEHEAHATFVRNLRFAAPRLRAAGLNLLIEPINTRDVPGFFLCGTRQALDIIDEVGAGNLFLQYDVYHMQIMEGDPAATIAQHVARIRHVQVADVPGRHEPGTGAINFDALFSTLDRVGYTGWVGCEYIPAANTVEGLRWARPYLT
jgi:hydroxypyruvate isomerase